MANFEIKPSKADFDAVGMKYPCPGWDWVLDSESEELPVLKGESGGDNWAELQKGNQSWSHIVYLDGDEVV
ncbi:hypothetical protein BTUL_0116g00100 [Botrytis tulipae]|uniref:Uncharacterized protein n=1 Tax=Botrytis tulipae TaxID=87230 RepID=A0A4Z1EFN0_9HELO|nr:hypothetical protein BTUL_0116g00100 [Botrytis tulipae]